MLVVTLNHNLPELTDNLVNQLKRDSLFGEYELMVVDNGSSEGNVAQSTTHRLDKNVFFGGGFNVVLDYFIKQTTHDYLYFLNNDLIFHGVSFLTTSKKEAIESDAAVYSPSIINASVEQCHWKQMWNWGNGLRDVKWVDFQSPLLRRDIATEISQYPMELIYGWGLDFYTGMIGEQMGVKHIVSDNNTITHLNSQTFKQNKIDIGVSEFCRIAEGNMNNYFMTSDKKDIYLQYRKYGESYNG